jgi:hypothetical protein
MTFNELMMFITFLEPEKLRVDIDGSKFIEVDRKEYI